MCNFSDFPADLTGCPKNFSIRFDSDEKEWNDFYVVCSLFIDKVKYLPSNSVLVHDLKRHRKVQ